MSEEEKNRVRSKKMIKMFEAMIDSEMKKFPVPPFSSWLNGKILSVNRREMEIEYDVRKEMTNPTGLLPGGMQAAILDETIGIMTTTLGYKGFLLSIDLHIDYLSKAKLGSRIKAIAKVVREGRNVVHVISEIYDMEDNLIATGNSNLLKTHYKPDYTKFSKDKK